MARVISQLDPSFMASLEVTLLKDQGNTPGDDAQTHIVRYASPFFGYTPFEFMGKNTGENSTIEGFNDTQKSYGMWMVPPDVGVNVLVYLLTEIRVKDIGLPVCLEEMLITWCLRSVAPYKIN